MHHSFRGGGGRQPIQTIEDSAAREQKRGLSSFFDGKKGGGSCEGKKGKLPWQREKLRHGGGRKVIA